MGSTGDWSWIDDELRRLGMSRTKLAHLLGVSTPAVSSWIKRRQNPSFEHLAQLAALFTGGDINRLYHRAGYKWGEALEDLAAQAAGMGVQLAPDSRDAEDLVALTLPAGSLHARDPITSLLAEESILAANALLRQANRFAELRAQATRLIARLNGGRSPLTGQMWYALADAELMLGNYTNALDAADMARRMAQGRNGAALVADSYTLSGEAWRVMGNWSEARSHCNEGSRLYLSAGLGRGEGQMWIDWNLGRIATSEGRYEEALEHFDRMAMLARELAHRSGATLQRYGVAMLADLQGDLGHALRQYSPMRRDARRDGDVYWDAMALWKLADVMRRQGELARAASMAGEAMRVYEAMNNSDMVASVAFTLAYCHIHLGQAEQARVQFVNLGAQFAQSIDKTTVRMARIGERYAKLALLAAKDDRCFDALLPLIEPDPALPRLSLRYELLEALFAAEGLRLNARAAAACDRYAAIEKQAAQHQHGLERAHALLGMSESARVLGRRDHELARQALAEYERIGAAWGRVHARVTLALLTPDQATPHLREAGRIARAPGMQDELRLIDQLLQRRPAPVPHALVFV